MATKKKQRKIQDEHREFKAEWTDDYAFVSSAGLPLCLICNEKLANNKKSNIERHFSTKHAVFANKYAPGDERKKAVVELKRKNEQSTSMFSSWIRSSSSTTEASFAVAQEIAKHGKPFTDGDYIKTCFLNMAQHLFSNFKNKDDIITKIKDTPLSAKTIHDRTIRMAENVTAQQVDDIKSASAFSLACDESCDLKDIAQLSLLGRYVSSRGVQEELLALLPLKGQTRGEDIYAAVSEFLSSKGIDANKLVSIATDGAPSMTGKNKGFISLFKQNLRQEVFTFHCIIHQEALCAQTFPAEIVVVMDLVVKIVNQIMAKGLNHRQFCTLLEEVSSHYSDLLLHNKVRWLSRGAVLKRFSSCLDSIKIFLTQKGLDYPELRDDHWLQKFYFAVDMTSHLNQLNRKLQGKGNTANTLLETVLSFEQQLMLFAQDIDNGKLLHFMNLRSYHEATKNEIDKQFFKTAILNMLNSFRSRFNEFRQEKATLSFLTKPLEANIDEINFLPFPTIDKAQFALQLADLRIKDLWASKFSDLKAELENLEREKCSLAVNHKWMELTNSKKEDQIIFEVWKSLPECYEQLKAFAFGILTIFGSTYSCEQTFSNMNFIKSKLRSQLTEVSLETCLKLKTTTYSPDIEKLCASIQQQKSH